MTNILKVRGPEVSIASANDVSGSVLVRVINTGAAAVLNIAYSNNTVYANVTVSNTESIVVEKGATDVLTGANMRAAPIAYRN